MSTDTTYHLDEMSTATIRQTETGQWACDIVWREPDMGETVSEEITLHDTEQAATEHARAYLTDHETDPSWGSCGKCGHDNVMRPERDNDNDGPSDCTYCDTIAAITDDRAYAFATDQPTPRIRDRWANVDRVLAQLPPVPGQNPTP